LQGWDAVMIYAYAQEPLNNGGTPSNWNAFNDPALIATLPAAALLYRQGHIKEANTVYALTPDKNQMFYQSISTDNSVAARVASEKGKLVVVMPDVSELPWLKKGLIPPDSSVIKNLGQTMIADDANEIISDTGEIRRNWAKAIYTINTPCTQAAMGRLGNAKIVLPDVTMDMQTRNASVAVQSMDGKPIRQSARLMISMGTQAIPAEDMMSFRSEPIYGKLMIHARKGMKLFTRTRDKQEKKVPVNYIDGNYFISLEKIPGAAWLFLQ
jgi:hypothetical protein